VTALETDYLVVGAGAMGMAFTDTLVTETDAQVVIVDRGHAPGGHWNRAYPFVRLHQPSAYYGVNSRGLGSDRIDQLDWNEGLYELATVGEICAYFERVMHQDLLPSGQVSYFPMAEYLGDRRFRTLAGGDQTSTSANESWTRHDASRAAQPDQLVRGSRPDGLAVRGAAGPDAAHVCPADRQVAGGARQSVRLDPRGPAISQREAGRPTERPSFSSSASC